MDERGVPPRVQKRVTVHAGGHEWEVDIEYAEDAPQDFEITGLSLAGDDTELLDTFKGRRIYGSIEFAVRGNLPVIIGEAVYVG